MTGEENNQLMVADTIASMVSRLRFLGKKSKNDDETLALQRRQIEQLTEELATVEHNSRFDLAELQKERDHAIRRVTEVQALIDKIGNDALGGMRAIRGDQTPAVIPTKPAQDAGIADRDARLPRMVQN